MKNCLPGQAKITGRARALDVTPEPGKGTEGGMMDATINRRLAP